MKNLFFNCKNRLCPSIINILNIFVSTIIFLTIISLLVYMIFNIIHIISAVIQTNFTHTLHDIAFMIVLIKAYKILSYYLEKHHISIKYILEVAIVAPIIEVIFVSDEKVWWLTVIYAVFSLCCLIIYFSFYEKIKRIDI